MATTGSGCSGAGEPGPATPAASAASARPEPPLRAPPPKDTDGDGVADMHDQCPDTFARAGEWREHPGCPAPRVCLMILPRHSIVISEKVLFAPGSSTIASEAEPRLDTLAQAYKENPDLMSDVAGHCDKNESRALAKQRAENVRAALIARGADPAQLVVVDAPPCQGQTPEERRVEFPNVRER